MRDRSPSFHSGVNGPPLVDDPLEHGASVCLLERSKQMATKRYGIFRDSDYEIFEIVPIETVAKAPAIIDLSDEEVADLNRVWAEFDAWQKRLDKEQDKQWWALKREPSALDQRSA